MITKVGAPIATVVIYTDDVKYKITGTSGDPDSDILSISTNKDLHNPEGTFSIAFVPRKDAKGRTWFDKLDAFDYVEIYLQGIDDEVVNPSNGQGIIMRGLIDNVSKTESWEEGKPRRQITVSGRDLGALLTEMKIYFIPELDPAASILKDIVPLGAQTKDLLDTMAARVNASDAMDFIMKLFKKSTFMRLGIPDQISINIGDKINFEAQGMYPNDECNLFYLQGYEDNYWSALTKYEDKPFHEIFVYDAPDFSWIILRPNRWKDVLGKYSKQVQALIDAGGYSSQILYPNEPFFTIDSVDKVSVTVEKHASEIYNYFLTIPDISFLDKVQCRAWMLDPFRSNPEACENPFFQTDEKLPAFMGKFGFRKYEVTTAFVDLDVGQFDTPDQGKAYEEQTVVPAFQQKGVERNRTLVAWLLHNQYLLGGTIDMRGTNQAIIGTYLLDKDEDMQYYVEGVSHSFINFANYTTTLRVERGMPKDGLTPWDRYNKYKFGSDSRGVNGPITVPGHVFQTDWE